MSFSETNERHDQCLLIAVKTFTSMTKRMNKKLDGEHATNNDFELILCGMIRIYVDNILAQLEPEDREGAMNSLFSSIMAIFVPIMDAEKAHAAFEHVLNEWFKFERKQNDTNN